MEAGRPLYGVGQQHTAEEILGSHLDKSKMSAESKKSGFFRTAKWVDVGSINGAPLHVDKKALIDLLNKNITNVTKLKTGFLFSRGSDEGHIKALLESQLRLGTLTIKQVAGQVSEGAHLVSSTTPETRSRTSTKVDNTAENVIHGSEKNGVGAKAVIDESRKPAVDKQVSAQELHNMTAVVSKLKCRVQDYEITKEYGPMPAHKLKEEGRIILNSSGVEKRSNDEYVGISAYQNENGKWILEIRHPTNNAFKDDKLKALMKEAIQNLAREKGVEPSAIETVGGTLRVGGNYKISPEDNMNNCNKCLSELNTEMNLTMIVSSLELSAGSVSFHNKTKNSIEADGHFCLNKANDGNYKGIVAFLNEKSNRWELYIESGQFEDFDRNDFDKLMPEALENLAKLNQGREEPIIPQAVLFAFSQVPHDSSINDFNGWKQANGGGN